MKKSYKVLGNIKHDGKGYSEGSTIDLNDDEVKELREAGAIGDETAAPTPPAATAPTDDAKRLSAIVDAISKLDSNDATLFTAGGAPKTEPLTAITGWPVAAKDRDAAWASVQAKQ